jgi:Family of unknown function (DUF6636)
MLLGVSSRAMVNRCVQLFPVLAVAAIALAACGGVPDERSEGTTPTNATAEQPQVSATRAQPVESTSEAPPPANREVLELTGFISPTGNVACMMDISWARCDIIDHDWSPPPRPADCEFDYGQGITLSLGGPAEFVCAGDTAFGPDEVLPYGSSITAGALRCDSADSGFTCRDVESGHGFSISRAEYKLF